MKRNKGKQFAKLSPGTQRFLNGYREIWNRRLAQSVCTLTDEKYSEIFHSFYNLLGQPAPLVVQVDSPVQLMLMPALLRIRALSDERTWVFIRDNLKLPLWANVVESLEEKLSKEDIEVLLARRERTTNFHFLDSVFGRPKGHSIDSRLGFFESLLSNLDTQMSKTVTAEIRDWIASKCVWPDGGMPGVLRDFVNQEQRAEISRYGQLQTAVQNLSNMGTTQRAALRIFRERGDATSFVPDDLVRQGELESQFIEQLNESTVNILAQGLSARNLEPTIYESYPPALESLLDGSSTGLWFTGQLAVGFTASIFYPHIERLPMFTFLEDAGERHIFNDATNHAIRNLRVFLANRTPVCPFGEIVFVSKPPVSCKMDEDLRFHSFSAPALIYEDGYELYSIHGVTVDKRTVMAPETLTVSDIESEINLEKRRIMMDRFGISRYLLESGAEVLNEDRYGTLYRRRLPGDEPLVMVRVINSTPEPDGTLREYFLRVPPFMRTAKEAVAWTFNFAEDQYQPEEES